MSSQELLNFLRTLPNPTVEELRLDWQDALARLWSSMRSWASPCVESGLLEVRERAYFHDEKGLGRVDLSVLNFKTAHGSAEARPVKRIQCDSRGVVYLERGPKLFVLQRHLDDDDWTISSSDEFLDTLPPHQTQLATPRDTGLLLDDDTFTSALIYLLG